MKDVVVKNTAVQKIKSFNPWIYKNEIKKISKNLKSGEIVRIYSTKKEFLGLGYANPLSKITIRILTFFKEEDINKEFFKKRIENAHKKRIKFLKNTNAFRIIHSEADDLPGLIVDYFNKYLSIQINTAGIEGFREEIIQSLVEVINPEGIYEKSDEKARKKEGLKTEEKIIYGNIPEKIVIEENGVHFFIDLKTSQKTGFYLDQRKNRKIVSEYVEKGFRVLDLFSNTGGFGIYAGKKGADFIKFVDISESAVLLIGENAKLNNLKNFEIVKANVFNFVKEEVENEKKYDLIILDPPSFAKTKHEKEGALRGFKYLIINSLKLLKKDGYLSVFSCSHHVSLTDLLEITKEAAKDTSVRVEILEHLFQDIDHPYLLNIPMSLYLKGFLLRKI